jgi:hypothetical protein
MVGTAGTASRYAASAERDLDVEIEAISRALREHGPTGRRRLGELVGGDRWGPRRFDAALAATVREGRARRLSRGTYGPKRAGGATAADG